jgi:hypothetical protein
MKHEAVGRRFPKQRKYRRFDLELPVHLRFEAAGKTHELAGLSRNVSIGGLLVESSDQIPLRTRVALKIDIVRLRSGREQHLLAEGEIIRVEPLAVGTGFGIAIECKPPITEVEDDLLAAS